MKLSIIIVSYNVKYFLEQCLCSIQNAASNIQAEVLVIDNCSTDDTLPYLQQRFAFVTFIKNTANEGYAKASNKALAIARGEYILFLNPDTIIGEDVLQRCLQFFESYPDAGAAGVRMTDGSGNFLPESKRSFPSPAASFYKLTGLSSLFPSSKTIGKYALGFLPETGVYKVDVLTGAFIMLRRKTANEINGFDEDFFMYGEDIDLCYRIQKAGYQNYYLGDTAIVHFKGESTKKESVKYVYTFYNAMHLFVKKHYQGMAAQLLSAGIFLRGIVSVVGLPFFYLINKTVTTFKPKHVVLTGSAIRTKQALQIVRQYYTEAQIQEIKTEDLNTTKLKNKLLVFCTGELSCKTAITLQQDYRNIASFMWFGKNTQSIVGSSSKYYAGDILAKKH